MKLNVKAFALACGVILGLGLMAGTWFAILVQGSVDAAKYDGLLTKVLWGYELTLFGGIFGFGWGLLNGLIGGAIFASLYNTLAQRWSRPAA